MDMPGDAPTADTVGVKQSFVQHVKIIRSGMVHAPIWTAFQQKPFLQLVRREGGNQFSQPPICVTAQQHTSDTPSMVPHGGYMKIVNTL